MLTACGLTSEEKASTATIIAMTFVAEQTQNAPTPIATTPISTPLPTNYPVQKCMSLQIPANVASSFSWEFKECVESVTILGDGSMKVNFVWQYTRLEEGSLHEDQCLTKGSDFQNRNMYMTDDLGNRYDHSEVGTDINIAILCGAMETNSFSDYFLFPPANPEAKFLIFHDDDQGIQTDSFDIVWNK